MEPNAQYALHDAEDGAAPWAALVRLTPELLALLRRPGARASLRLNAAAPGQRSRRTSELAVAAPGEEDEEDEEQRYELLSFTEDPRTHHVCAFREEPRGFAVHRAGAVHQKLMVQRLLDSAEKHRVKDRHERSVREYKARASKLLDAPEPKAKRARLALPTRATATAKAVAAEPAAAELRLPSALTAEEARDMRARIEAGAERPEAESSGAGDDLFSEETDASAQEDAGSVTDASVNDLMTVGSPKSAATGLPKTAKPTRKRATKEAASSVVRPSARRRSNMAEKDADSKEGGDDDAARSPKKRPRQNAAPLQGLDRFLSEVKTPANDPKPVESVATTAEAASAEGDTGTQNSKTSDVGGRSVATVKRPRQRAVPMPDLSFFPPVVAEICERVARHKSRSAVLDEQDYDAFVDQYEGFQRDWETLDKAYSIEFILCEGLQLQLEMAPPELRESLQEKITASRRKAEGLQFVQTTMSSIQKLLGGIQASVARFDRKQSVSSQ